MKRLLDFLNTEAGIGIAVVLFYAVVAIVLAINSGCINKPAKVVYFEVNAGGRSTNSEGRRTPTSRPVAASVEGTPHPTGSTDAGAGRAGQSGLGWSDADKAAVEFGMRELAK